MAPVWEVRLPDRRRATLGATRPSAQLVIHPGAPDEERMTLPTSVAKVMAAKQRAGEVHPESRAELLFVVGEVARSCATSRIGRLVNRRDYSSDELRAKLRADGYAHKTIEEAIERAQQARLVDDRRYADVYIRSKVAAGWGMARIERELSRRGVDVSEIAGWPYDYLDPEDELTRATQLASTRHYHGDHVFEKTVRYLCGRGFSLSVATRAARSVVSEQDDVIGF